MIHPLRLSELVFATGGRLISGDVEFSGVSTDSRDIKPGEAYLALKGERFDGHNFITDAVDNGAVAVIASEKSDMEFCAVPVLKVVDTHKAYADIAHFVRKGSDAKVVALTGSCGKTSTKEILSVLLRSVGPTLATEKNLNNTIGVPKTLLNLNQEHEFAVIEMGANAPGEIEFSVNCAAPNFVVLLNASAAHTEGFGGIAGVRNAKSEILTGLSETAVAVLNKDDPGFDFFRSKLQGQEYVSFGLVSQAEVTARRIEVHPTGSQFQLDILGEMVDVYLPLPGRHQIVNFLAAAAIAYQCGASLTKIAGAASSLSSVPGRLSATDLEPGFTLFDDSYNANPASVIAGLELLSTTGGRKLAVLGDMAELGEESFKYHSQILDSALTHADDVWVYGSEFTKAATDTEAKSFSRHVEIVKAIMEISDRPLSVLVKGSRSMAMDKVAAELITTYKKRAEK